MNSLQNLLDIQLHVAETISAGPPTRRSTATVGVLSDMPLTLVLSVTLTPSGGDRQHLVQAFLAQIGEHDLEKVFEALFQRIAITPFLLSASHLLLNDEMHTSGAPGSATTEESRGEEVRTSSTFVMGVPFFMEESWDERFISLRDFDMVDESGVNSFSSSAKCAILGRTQIVDSQKAAISNGVVHSDSETKYFRTYHLTFQVPVSGASSQPTLVFVIHLLLGKATETLARDSVMTRVLSRQGAVGLDSESMLCSSGVLPMVVLGYGYIPVILYDPLRCRSVSRTLARDHISLSLSVVNTFHCPIQLCRAVFDMHTTRVLSDEEKKVLQVNYPCLNAQNQRVGQRWEDSATVQMVLQALSVTPVMTQDEKLPILIQPEETYSFQFNIQLLPEVSYWLHEGPAETRSWSERFFDVDHMRRIMSMSFCTTIFIDCVVQEQNEKTAFSISRRHPVRWSFTEL